MSRITITEDGREVVVTDIAPYKAELAATLEQLDAIYTDFEKSPIHALEPREGEIVDLLNRQDELGHIIERFEAAAVRRANILDGWEVVKRHRAGGGA